jgi:hypothetical protein
MQQIYVNLTPREAADIVYAQVINSGVTPECLGSYSSATEDGHEVILLVFEKYFMRTSSRAALTVMFEDLGGRTVATYQGSGGGTSALFKFDWGVADSLDQLVVNALRQYQV